jgi:hypothetical protein
MRDASGHVPHRPASRRRLAGMAIEADGHRQEGDEDHLDQRQEDGADEAGQEAAQFGVRGGFRWVDRRTRCGALCMNAF